MIIQPEEILFGWEADQFINAPFSRFSQDVANYPGSLEDVDDTIEVKGSTFERYKPFEVREEDTVGTFFWLPRDDNDVGMKWGDNDMDYLYGDPADPNLPTMDHRSDEEFIWHFNKNIFAQDVIENLYKVDPHLAERDNKLPKWTKKFIFPKFFTEEGWMRALEARNYRIGLDNIRKRHAMDPDQSPQTLKQ